MSDLDFDADSDTDWEEQRRYPRSAVYEPVLIIVGAKEYDGIIVDMSAGGAAITLEVQVDKILPVGTALALVIEGMGRIPATVVRPIQNDIAVQLTVGEREKKHLFAALKRILDEIPADER